MSLRRLLAAVYHWLFPALRRFGLDLQLKRNVAYGIVGLQSMWGKDEPAITRGLVVEHQFRDQGMRFFIADENDLIQQLHLMGTFYGIHELDLIGQYYTGGTFVDVGANVGNHALYALRYLKAPKLIAFEPNPRSFAILQYNLLLNNLSARAVLHDVGLSERSMQASIDRSPDRNLGGTSFKPAEGGSFRLENGDELIGEEPVGFIKIDVESAEIGVLAGLAATIDTCRPTIYVEVDPDNEGRFRKWLAQVRYEIKETLGSDENANYLIVPLA